MAKLTLKAARINVGLSQKAVAGKLGVSEKTVGNWENGISSPKVSKIDNLCALYGVSYDDLIFLESNPL